MSAAHTLALVCVCAWVAVTRCGSRTGLYGPSATDGGPIPASCTNQGLVVLYAGEQPQPGLNTSTALAVDASSVYFVTKNPTATFGGTVMKAPLCGGTATTLASATYASEYVFPGTLAINAANVYWVGGDEAAGAPGGQILMTPLDGGTSTTVVSEQIPIALALDATSVYWTDMRSGTVMKAPLEGGTPVPLVLPGKSTGLGGIAVDATDVYWWVNGYGILKVPVGGGQLETVVLASPDMQLGDLTVSGDSLYWANIGSGIFTQPVGGATPVLLASDTGVAGAIAVDGTSVYWLSAECSGQMCGTDVKKVPVGGGASTVVASFPSATYGWGSIAVDATSVYWTSGNSVMKMTPK